MSVVLAIDAGTSSVRTLAVNQNGEILASSQKKFRQYFPSPGLVEHDAEEIWRAASLTLSDVSKKIYKLGLEVSAIGITNQRETSVAWDAKTGKPIQKAIVWQDRRTSDRCKELEEGGYLDLIRSTTGLVLDPYFSASKFEWMIKHGSIKPDKNLRFGTIDSWLIWRLTGGRVHATDPSNASRTMLFDLNSGKWSESLIELFSIPKSSLPEVRSTSGDFGETTIEGPLGKNIPIRSAVGDQQSSLFGQLCFNEGDTKNTYGTGSFILSNIGENITSPKNGLLTTVAWQLNSTSPLIYALEGSIFSTGSTIQWLCDQLGIIDDPKEISFLAESVIDSGGVVMVPAFTGLGSPWWNPKSKGMLAGLTRGTGKAEIARAAVESMAFQTRDVIEAMKMCTSHTPKALKVDGGAAVINLLMQIQADQLQIPIIRSKNSESTAMGAAYLAGLGVGLWSSLEELKALWQTGETFNPQVKVKESDSAYKKWLSALGMVNK